jgi:membrane-associated protease RseP (regulator of RpoE activity)
MSGMTENELIIYVDGTKINYTEDFIKVMEKKRAGESIFIVTNRSEYNITLAEHPENSSMGYLGIQVDQKKDVKKGVTEKYGDFFPGAFLWIAELFFWLYLLNFGIGLFNLVPLGPILDGGRMLQLLMHKFFKKKKGDIIWKIISLIFLGLVLINVLWPFIQNIVRSIIGFF